MEKCYSCGFSFPAKDGIPVRHEPRNAYLCPSCFDNHVTQAMERSRAARERLWQIEQEFSEGGVRKVSLVRV